MPITDESAEGRLAEAGIEAVRLEGGSAPFPLWLITAPDTPAASAFAMLSASEQRRAARFRFGHLRDRYVAAHAALRVIVERTFGIPAMRQRYIVDAFGKPHLADMPQAQCSISYSGDHALIGVAAGAPIGVDIEMLRHVEDATDLMRVYFTKREQSALGACPVESLAFHRLFLGVWTRKEACVKAVGQGLGGVALARVECGVGGLTTVRVGSSQLRTDTTRINCRYIAAWACGTVSEN
jgi:4'-phosphopantetheinyl transferase